MADSRQKKAFAYRSRIRLPKYSPSIYEELQEWEMTFSKVAVDVESFLKLLLRSRLEEDLNVSFSIDELKVHSSVYGLSVFVGIAEVKRHIEE